MKVIKCDRCGKVEYTNNIPQPLGIWKGNEKLDLCDKCYLYFSIWLKKKCKTADYMDFLADMRGDENGK